MSEELPRVKAKPGGRVAVSITPQGIQLRGDGGMWAELLEALVNIGSFLALVAGGIGAAVQFAEGRPLAGAGLAIAAAVLGVPFLKYLVDSVVGFVLLPVFAVVALAMLPFRAGRRRIKQWWFRFGDADPLFTPVEDIVGVTTTDGPVVAVVVDRKNRSPLRLRADGETGTRLREQISRLGC
ncbi:MAG: hypothetical protein ACRDXX_09625 [Stackebrandtia sp.]